MRLKMKVLFRLNGWETYRMGGSAKLLRSWLIAVSERWEVNLHNLSKNKPFGAYVSFLNPNLSAKNLCPLAVFDPSHSSFPPRYSPPYNGQTHESFQPLFQKKEDPNIYRSSGHNPGERPWSPPVWFAGKTETPVNISRSHKRTSLYQIKVFLEVLKVAFPSRVRIPRKHQGLKWEALF